MEDNYEITGMYDYVFKKAFEKEEHLVPFLKLITGIDFSNMKLSLINTEKKSGSNIKGIDADIIAEFEDSVNDFNIVVDVEPQEYNLKDISLLRREIHYASLFFSDMYPEGSIYKEERKFYSIFLMDKYGQKGYPITKTSFHTEGVNQNSDIFCFYHVYLKQILSEDFKIKNENDKMILELVRLLKAVDLSTYLNNDNKFLKGVAMVIDYVKGSKEERWAAIARYKAEQTKKNREAWAKELGIEEGKEKQLVESIKTMAKNGLSNSDIAKYLSLDEDFVKEALTK